MSQDANTAAAAAAACQPGLRHVRGDDVRGTERQRMSECHKWIYCETLTTLTEFTRTRPFVQFVWGGGVFQTGPDRTRCGPVAPLQVKMSATYNLVSCVD